MDVPSGEIVLRGLSMPHSPRWHDGRLWLLESGNGTLSVVDLDAARAETVAELPGFTRGLAFAGNVAFVGPLAGPRVADLRRPAAGRTAWRSASAASGWSTSRAGKIAGFLRFEELVQEVFDVALLAGFRPYPEIAEEGSDAATQSFVLPEAVRQPG